MDRKQDGVAGGSTIKTSRIGVLGRDKRLFGKG